jgi:hypothetical protein
MCAKCIELDPKIDHYRELARNDYRPGHPRWNCESHREGERGKSRAPSGARAVDFADLPRRGQGHGLVEHYCSRVVQDAETGRSMISVSDPRFGSKQSVLGGVRCVGTPAIYQSRLACTIRLSNWLPWPTCFALSIADNKDDGMSDGDIDRYPPIQRASTDA